MKQVNGEMSYNGYKLNEFVPRKTSAYISQNDVHIGEMTVKETLDFSARCQGVGTRYGNLICSTSIFVLLAGIANNMLFKIVWINILIFIIQYKF